MLPHRQLYGSSGYGGAHTCLAGNEPHREPGQAADIGVASPRVGSVELNAPDSGDQLVKDTPSLELRQVSAKAVVNAGAESEMIGGFAVDAEGVRVRVVTRVAVGGGVQQEQPRARWDRVPVDVVAV